MAQRPPALTPEKRRLLSKLVAQRQPGGGVRRAALSRADRAKPLPLSFGQERLWFLDQLAPGNPFYNDCEAFRLRGPLDVAALERSLNRIIERHEILRTTFRTIDGRPWQEIAPALVAPLDCTDLADLDPQEQAATTTEIAGASLDQPFDLESLPLLRFHLVRHGKNDHLLLFTLHHIIFDGWSLGVFVRELMEFYESEVSGTRPRLPELTLQYADFATWQRHQVAGESSDRQLAYWRERLASPARPLELPTDRPRPESPSYRGGLCGVELGAELSLAARRLSGRENVTLFVVLLAAYKTLLMSLSGQTDLIVGTPIANRSLVETEPLLGFFLNTLALRSDLSGDPTFRELLHRVAETNTGASENQDLPFERLVADLNPERQLNSNPLFQVWFTLLNAPMPRLEFEGLSLEFADIETRTARFDLALILWNERDTIKGHFEYSRDLFDAPTIERLSRQYQVIVDRAVQRCGAPLSETSRILEHQEQASVFAARQRRHRLRAARLSELGRGRLGPPADPDG